MSEDLLAIADLDPPMGDLSIGNRLDTVRSIWTRRETGEEDLPESRIIHQRILRLHGPARLDKLGLKPALGCHKCASKVDRDWVTAFRVIIRRHKQWEEILRQEGLGKPKAGRINWFPLHGVIADAVIIEIRRCGIDGGWSSWNLAMGACELYGQVLTGLAPRKENWLRTSSLNLSRLPKDIKAEKVNGSILYHTPGFRVGFRLDRPAFSWLSLGTENKRNLETNLLFTSPIQCKQGLHLHFAGEAPSVSPAVRCDLNGTVSVRGNRLSYQVHAGKLYFTYDWLIQSDRLQLNATREAKRSTLAWHSAAWSIAWSNAVSPTHTVGHLTTKGETGGVRLPAWINAPAYGTWLVESTDPAASLRSDCYRQAGFNLTELKVGEVPEANGLHRLKAGIHSAKFVFKPIEPPVAVRPRTPAVVKRALKRTYYVTPTFRPDLGSLSNNGASIGCPICADTWAAVVPRLDLSSGLQQGPDGKEILRVSLERILNGGPGYAAGVLVSEGKAHLANDEYLMTGAAALRAFGEYLGKYATTAWYEKHRQQMATELHRMRARDKDGDGLIESEYRTGISGLGEWSTCWLDVLSFGWKCAWSNAVLYGALRETANGLERFGDKDKAAELRSWMKQIKASYRDTFYNSDTGWLAGWRCKAGKLHDYAFLPVNGCAVRDGLLDRKEGRDILLRLLGEAERSGMPDPALGLPMNLWNIPDKDRADILRGYPFGYYQNGGRTHAQARHFIMGLYSVGLKQQADRLLKRLCEGLAQAATFGGNQTGIDWRTWDDTPCGYEGLLTDQFGILEPILWRWGK